jgi:hypothetical protein
LNPNLNPLSSFVTLRRRRLAAIEAQPTPLEATLRNIITGKESVTFFYSWKDSFGRAWNAKTKLLAPTEPGGESVLLDAALAWITLTDPERAGISSVGAAATVGARQPSRDGK